ncbi:hypothetical protein M514_06936 [Trichuris suis]|uniref:Perilipin family protein n=1 Tax=Trichuris suis TaxID=68888 RepID=A0A085NLI2_9BILA|nr:hypothetical protein M513_06936 [Trichuris suis]KFD70328.1 hypothetical protein M514_06936 [Trichuris suis]KHJ47836.1 hypothetical protein D918_01994 [Trichuris suis]
MGRRSREASSNLTSRPRSMSSSHREHFELTSRLDALPIVHYVAEQIFSLYDHTKKSNWLFNSTLTTTENALKSVVDRTQPLVQYFAPQLSFVDKLACSQLEKIENRFPSIKTHPEEVRDYGRRRYDQSYLKKGVDTIYSAKEFSVDKINETRQMCSNIMASLTTESGQKADLEKLMRLSQKVIDSAIEYTDSLVDKYIPPEDVEQFKAKKEEAKGYVDRLRCLSSKFASGVNKQAVDSYNSAKNGTLMAFQQWDTTLKLMNTLRMAQMYINEKSSASMSIAREQTNKAIGCLRTNYKHISSAVDQTTLWIVHMLAVNTKMVCDQLLGRCVKFLPQNASSAAHSAMTYVDDLCKTVAQAKSTGEVKDELITEAGEKIEFCRRRFLDALGNAAEYAPVSWVAISLHGIELDDDFLVIDRSLRMPAHMVTLYLQPRLGNQFHRG